MRAAAARVIVSRTIVVTPQLPDAFIRHRSLSILGVAAIQSAIAQGRFRSTSSAPHSLGSEFVSIYRLRAEHLGRSTSAHAVQLRTAVLGLCAALEELPPECLVIVSSLNFDDGWSIRLFERADTTALLGALKMVDKRMVSEEDWATLWGKPTAG